MADLKIIYKTITDIRPYPNNPRHNAPGVDAVAASIREFGFKNPVIIDRTGEIVAGHTRIMAAEKLGLKKVPCIIADDLTEAQIKAFRIADNQTASLTGWNEELLSVELDALADMDFDLSITGFSDIEIGELLNLGRGGGLPRTNHPIRQRSPPPSLATCGCSAGIGCCVGMRQ